MDPIAVAIARSAKRTGIGNLVTALGDSITVNGGYETTIKTGGPHGYAWLTSNGRAQWSPGVAVGGYNLTQIRDTLLPQVIAKSPRPHYCVVLGGTNDIGTADAGAALAKLQQIYDRLFAAGIVPIACSIPPKNSASAADATFILSLNAGIARAAIAGGYPFVDYFAAVADPTGFGWATGTNLDAVHPNDNGAALMGAALNAALADLAPPFNVPLATYNGDTEVELANPLFLTDTDADGVPDQWGSIGSGGTIALTSGADVVGDWFTLTRASGSDNPKCSSAYMYDVGAGDVIAISFRYKVVVTGTSMGFNVPFYYGFGASTKPLNITALFYEDTGPHDFYAEFVVPVGMDNMKVNFESTGDGGSAYLGQLTIRNLTDLDVL